MLQVVGIATYGFYKISSSSFATALMRTSVVLSVAWICVQWISARADPESPLTGLESVTTPASASSGNDPGQRFPNQSADTGLPAPLTKQLITFNSHDLTLVGFLFKPEGPGPFPAIVWNHGSEKGPDRGPQFDTVAKVFVPAGYVVFAPMRRGHGESQGKYIVAVLDSIRRTRGVGAANQESVHLMESEQLNDQLAGLADLK